MKITFFSIAALSASVALCSTAYAMSPRQACKQDVQTYCSDVQRGQGRIIGCLEDHYKQLSDDCYSALQKRMDKKGGDDNGGPPPGGDHDGPPPQGGDHDGPPPHTGGGDDAPPPPPPGGDNGGGDSGSSN